MMSARQQVHACRRPLPKGVRLRCSSLRVSSTKSLPRWVGSGPIGTIGLENAAQLYAMRASAREATKNFNPEQNRSRPGGTGGTGGTRRGNARMRWNRTGYRVVPTALTDMARAYYEPDAAVRLRTHSNDDQNEMVLKAFRAFSGTGRPPR